MLICSHWQCVKPPTLFKELYKLTNTALVAGNLWVGKPSHAQHKPGRGICWVPHVESALTILGLAAAAEKIRGKKIPKPPTTAKAKLGLGEAAGRWLCGPCTAGGDTAGAWHSRWVAPLCLLPLSSLHEQAAPGSRVGLLMWQRWHIWVRPAVVLGMLLGDTEQ